MTGGKDWRGRVKGRGEPRGGRVELSRVELGRGRQVGVG